MNIEIREVTSKDAEKMIIYNKKVGSETDFLSFDGNTFDIGVEKEARFLERFARSKRDLMLVAIKDGEIIANASVETNKVKRYSHRAELSITVLKDHWRKGIGSEMIRRLIEFSKSIGIESLYLDVRADNNGAIALYNKMGFSEIGRYEKYFKIGEDYYDAILMVSHLL